MRYVLEKVILISVLNSLDIFKEYRYLPKAKPGCWSIWPNFVFTTGEQCLEVRKLHPPVSANHTAPYGSLGANANKKWGGESSILAVEGDFCCL